jgi:peptidoglycan/xylan/chitin deacetylase (PgdA/CDA1 family)
MFREDVVTAIYFHNPNRRQFARCVRWLDEHGYTFISARDLVESLYGGKKLPRGAVWLSFDDGYEDWLENVLPVVRERNVPVTFFIPSGIVAGDGLYPWLRRRESAASNTTGAAVSNGFRHAFTVGQVKQVAGCPEVTIGGHTVTHTVTSGLTDTKTRYELAESKRTLESWTGAKVNVFAYPEGRFDGHEKPLLKELGYELAATTQVAFVTRETDPYLVPRFCVPDDVTFPESLCNMVGAWRPVIDPVKKLLRK